MLMGIVSGAGTSLEYWGTPFTRGMIARIGLYGAIRQPINS